MLHSVGFEPTTHNLEGYCSNPTELRMQYLFKSFTDPKKTKNFYNKIKFFAHYRT